MNSAAQWHPVKRQAHGNDGVCLSTLFTESRIMWLLTSCQSQNDWKGTIVNSVYWSSHNTATKDTKEKGLSKLL